MIELIIGALFFAYIPGWFVVKLFFDDLEGLERILFAVICSIVIAMTIGVFFGYNKMQAAETGGFTSTNIWMGEIGITSILAIMLLIKQTFNKSNKLPPKRGKHARKIKKE